jgi:hypothetical protein
MFRPALLVLAIFLAAFAAAPAHAQQPTSELQGRIHDQQGAVLPGVAIVAKNEETGHFHETVSNVDGSFFLTRLTPGPYQLTAQLQGFKTYQRTGLRLEVGRTTTLTCSWKSGRSRNR